jgi:alpha-tubulin suppressor-like RCC1 family protein
VYVHLDGRYRPHLDRHVPRAVSIAQGRDEAFALTATGQVWRWRTRAQQPGNGEILFAPREVPEVGQVRAIATLGTALLILHTDGSVARVSGGAVEELRGISSVIDLAGGDGHAFLLREDKVLLSLGASDRGQLGRTPVDATLPVTVEVLPTVDGVAAGGSHSLGLRGGLLYGWGDNRNGQIAAGGLSRSAIAVRIGGLPVVRTMAAGTTHSLAVDDRGAVWAWGDNRWGQLGAADVRAAASPIVVAGLEDIVDVAAGRTFSVARGRDGALWL